MDRFGNTPVRDVTLAEMLRELARLPDDATFRYFQKSHVGPDGWAVPDETLRITVGELRRVLAASER